MKTAFCSVCRSPAVGMATVEVRWRLCQPHFEAAAASGFYPQYYNWSIPPVDPELAPRFKDTTLTPLLGVLLRKGREAHARNPQA